MKPQKETKESTLAKIAKTENKLKRLKEFLEIVDTPEYNKKIEVVEKPCLVIEGVYDSIEIISQFGAKMASKDGAEYKIDAGEILRLNNPNNINRHLQFFSECKNNITVSILSIDENNHLKGEILKY